MLLKAHFLSHYTIYCVFRIAIYKSGPPDKIGLSYINDAFMSYAEEHSN